MPCLCWIGWTPDEKMKRSRIKYCWNEEEIHEECVVGILENDHFWTTSYKFPKYVKFVLANGISSTLGLSARI